MAEDNNELFSLLEEANRFPYILFGLGFTFLIFLLYVFGGILTDIFLKDFIPGLSEGSWNAICELAFMLLPAIFMLRYMPERPGVTLMLDRHPGLSAWLVAVGGFAALFIFYTNYSYIQDVYLSAYFQPYYDNLKGYIEDVYRTLLKQGNEYAITEALIVGALIPAVSEEILFRGFLFGNLIKRLKPGTTIFITALLFAIVHFNPVGFIPLLLIGSWLGFTAYYTRSVTIPIVLHFLNNAISVFLMYSPQMESLDKNPSVIPIEYMLIMMLISGALLFLAGRYLVKNR